MHTKISVTTSFQKYFFLIRCFKTGRNPQKWFKQRTWKIKNEDVMVHSKSQAVSKILGLWKRENSSQSAVVWNSLTKQSDAQTMNMERPTTRPKRTNTAHTHLSGTRKPEKALENLSDITRILSLRSNACNTSERGNNENFTDGDDLKGHCHAIWQLYKKLGVFASTEFQN